MVAAIIGVISPNKSKELGRAVYSCTVCGSYIYKEENKWKLCECAESVLKETDNIIVLKIKPNLDLEKLKHLPLTNDNGEPLTEKEIKNFLKGVKKSKKRKVLDEEAFTWAETMEDLRIEEKMETVVRFSNKEICKLIHSFWDITLYFWPKLSLEDIMVLGVKELLERLQKSHENKNQEIKEDLNAMLKDAREIWAKIQKEKLNPKSKGGNYGKDRS